MKRWFKLILHRKAYRRAEKFETQAQALLQKCRRGDLTVLESAKELRRLHQAARDELLGKDQSSGLHGGSAAYEQIVSPSYSHCVTELEILRLAQRLE